MVTKKTVEVNRLRAVDGVMRQCGKFEFNASVDSSVLLQSNIYQS